MSTEKFDPTTLHRLSTPVGRGREGFIDSLIEAGKEARRVTGEQKLVSRLAWVVLTKDLFDEEFGSVPSGPLPTQEEKTASEEYAKKHPQIAFYIGGEENAFYAR